MTEFHVSANKIVEFHTYLLVVYLFVEIKNIYLNVTALRRLWWGCVPM